MFTTPPRHTMLRTRRTLRKDRVGNVEGELRDVKSDLVEVSKPQIELPPRPTTDASPRSSVKMFSPRIKTDTSSVRLTKQHEIEAARAKAEYYNKMLKDLEAKHNCSKSDLQSETQNQCPAQSEGATEDRVQEWLERSHHERCSGTRQPPAAPAPVSAPPAGTMHELADILKNVIIAARGEVNNDTLLTRLSTSKDLPLYFGDPLEWLQYKEAYYESTRLCKYTDNENLWRLRKSLRGEAKETVSSLLIGNITPSEIMAALELRYGRPEIIIFRITKEIRKLQPLPPNYFNEIINFAIKIKNYVAAVKAIKQTDYLRSPELITAVISKCPSSLITKWADYLHIYSISQKAKLELFADFLYEEANKTAEAGLSHIHSQAECKRKPEERKMAVQSILLNDAGNNNPKCTFCRGSNHTLPDCKRFKRALHRDRWRFVREKRLCFKCLVARHDKETCPAERCDVDDCAQAHHRLLHWNVRAPQANVSNVKSESAIKNASEVLSRQSPIQTETVAMTNNSLCVLLKVVPIDIYGPLGIISTYALLDDGATVSLISSSIADAVGITGQQTAMRLRGAFNSELNCNCEIITCKISNKENVKFNFSARKISELDLPLQKLATFDTKKYCYLNKMTNFIPCCTEVKPEVLIGQDNYDLIVPIKTLTGRKNQPAATLTPLGWCVHGVVSAHSCVPRSDLALTTSTSAGVPDATATSAAIHQQEYSETELFELVRQSFTFESIGVHNRPRENPDDKRAVAILEKTSRLIGQHWEVGLPWKSTGPLPDSFFNANRRLKLVERKINSNLEYGKRYRERINHLFENNYAREMNDLEPGNRTWYLPHFGVDNPNKKKLRIVFDAAATTEGKSLNDFLLQGPDLLESLLGIMFRFREGSVALMGDIKDMFLCIKIKEEDQKALQFLWRSDSSKPVKKYDMTSLIFGANCSPFIAQYIKNKNAQRFQDSMPDAVNAILKSHYMDDYIDSVNDVTFARKLVQEISYIHRQGGFEMRNWISNISEALDNLPQEILSNKAVQFSINNQPERTLGLLWFPATDVLSIDLSLKKIPSDILNLTRRPTKREMLRIIMSILDIHGFLSPFIVKGKILLRETWRKNMKWDETLSDELYTLFHAWIVQLNEVNNLKIPRWYFHCSERKGANALCASEIALELHLFCDASPSAYAAVAYWRNTYRGGRVTVSFVASKCRAAPIKPVSVPRLELQAALLSCRLANVIKQEHRIKPNATYFWTDSTTVLHWIRNETRKYSVFIANRLGEIDELSSKTEWHYISTHNNIADLATKCSEYNLHAACEWLRGPNFLHEDSATWTPEPEKEKMQINMENLEMINTILINRSDFLPVPDPVRFSSWLRLKRSTARMLQFIEKCKRKPAELNVELLKNAEHILIRFSQQQSFQIELKMLQDSKSIPRDSRLRALTPVIDENGLLRVGGRINAAKEVNPELKQPVILDGRHPVSKLIVKFYHESAAHGSTEMIVNELRQKYWLLNMRPTVRSVAAKCMLCRMKRARPTPPRLGDLPEDRLSHHQRPFTICGVDLFGPMEVTVGRQRSRRYGVLFTCMTVRAIHIEMVSSLTADSMIMALRRMASRRGWPQKILSDNGTNMRGAETELKKAFKEIDQQAVVDLALNNGVNWQFIPPASPHMGGAWERLIRSVKTALKVILKERAPKEEALSTLLLEVENIVNGRPLTHVSVDPGSLEALTPNHFLIGSSSNLPVPGVFDDGDFYLKKQWRISQRLADIFWSRWIKEILPTLIPRGKWQRDSAPLKIGDVVVVVDPNLPRNVWPKGKVVKVYPGSDGRVRVLDVKTKSGVLKRPAARVALLLGSECRDHDTGGENVADTAPEIK